MHCGVDPGIIFDERDRQQCRKPYINLEESSGQSCVPGRALTALPTSTARPRRLKMSCGIFTYRWESDPRLLTTQGRPSVADEPLVFVMVFEPWLAIRKETFLDFSADFVDILHLSRLCYDFSFLSPLLGGKEITVVFMTQEKTPSSQIFTFFPLPELRLCYHPLKFPSQPSLMFVDNFPNNKHKDKRHWLRWPTRTSLWLT